MRLHITPLSHAIGQNKKTFRRAYAPKGYHHLQ
jgi:hypothetical protein